jgi:serine/threonine protein phosphatase PrpC
MSSYLRPVYHARTDTGRQRDHNEDAVYAAVLPSGGDGPAPWYVFAVADGVGGLERGEWASRTAIDVFDREVLSQLRHVDPRGALQAAFEAANTAVLEGGAGGHPKQRAASTLVAALVREGIMWWAHVGDSRAYLIRQGRAQRLTQDHSWVEEQVRAGIMTPEDARLSERRHAITRSIGYDTRVQADLGGPIVLRSGDAVVLCSDGLHGAVADDELARVAQQLLPEAATERLVALSNERGGPDNISVIVCVMVDASVDRSARAQSSAATQATLP